MENGIRISRHGDVNKPALWKIKDKLSQKQGPHATVYLINGDRYVGDWENNLRHGKGIHYYKKNGYQYEGEFKNDQRSGYGILSIPVEDGNGESSQDQSSIFEKKAAKIEEIRQVRKVYTGSWLFDKRHGQGTYFYPNGDIYQGSWANDMKDGWGKLRYADGSVYEGEFHQEKRHGQGVMLLKNGDRYEGMWFNDEKEGPGKYVFIKKRQCMEGEWCKGMLKCGVLLDLAQLGGKETAHRIPVVIEEQRANIYEERTKDVLNPLY